MKKIFTLIALAAMALGVNAQTATDAYLDVANYASLDDIDLKNCTKLYSYDAEKKVLVVSAYAVQQSSVAFNEPETKAIGWFSCTASNSAGTSWDKTGDFNGSAYYGTLSGGSASDRGLNTKNHYSFFVTNMIKVSALIHSKSKSRTVTMDVYPVTFDGTTATRGEKAGSASDNTNSITPVTVEGLDNTTIYEVEFYSSDNNGGHLYEVAFYQGGGDEPVDPVLPPTAATTWDFTTTTADMLDGGWAEDSSTAGRYVYGTEIAADTFVDLGTIGFSYGAGISVGRSGGKLEGAKAIRVDLGKQIQLNASNGVYIITGLAKDDVVNIRFASASSSEERTFTIANGDKESITATVSDDGEGNKKADVVEETITVAKNGDLKLTQSKGINVKAITINADLPEAGGGTGIKNVTTTANSSAIYNLAGQKVSESYKGVVIQNGKKMINK